MTMKKIAAPRFIHFWGNFFEISPPKYAPMKHKQLKARIAPSPTSNGAK